MDLLHEYHSILSAHLWQSFIQDFWMSKIPGKMSQSSEKVGDVRVPEGLLFQQFQLTYDMAQTLISIA